MLTSKTRGWALLVSGLLFAESVFSQIPTLDHFVWSAVPSPQYVSNSFAVVLTAKDASNSTLTGFSGTANLKAGSLSTNVLSAVSPQGPYGPGGFTDGYAFTPNSDLTVTHVRHYEGVKVSIWTDAGTLVVSRSVVSVPGTWVETALTTPVTLRKNTRYRIGVYYPTSAPYYTIVPYPTSFADGTINGGYFTGGDTFPNQTFGALSPVDIRYTVPATTNVAISPTVSGTFVSGVWTGNVAVLQAASNIVLRADDGLGHSGLSGVFDVIGDEPRLVTQPVNQVLAPGSTATFAVTAQGVPPLSYFWMRNGVPIAGATASSYSTNSVQLADSGAQFSCLVSNAYGTLLSSNALLTVSTNVSVITFDDITTPPPGDYNYPVISNGYCTLNWSNFYVLNAATRNPPDGYQTGMISASNVAWNGTGSMTTISKPTPFNIRIGLCDSRVGGQPSVYRKRVQQRRAAL